MLDFVYSREYEIRKNTGFRIFPVYENEQKLLSNNIFAGTIDNKSILYKGDFNEVVIKNDDLRTYIDFYFICKVDGSI